MRRLLFVTIALVLLLGSFSPAFAQEPEAVLGEVWFFFGNGFIPGERVDMYLFRPSTEAGWPFAGGPNFGTYFAPMFESADRRQSYPAFQFADEFGGYFAEFMLPREETWYPCSYPYKWKCNFVIFPGSPLELPVVEWHSPVNQGNFEFPLIWPWYDTATLVNTGDIDMALAAANPADTVAPLQAKMIGASGNGFIFSWEVTGYFWKLSDLHDPFTLVTLP
jgi:hypothetical protein